MACDQWFSLLKKVKVLWSVILNDIGSLYFSDPEIIQDFNQLSEAKFDLI